MTTLWVLAFMGNPLDTSSETIWANNQNTVKEAAAKTKILDLNNYGLKEFQNEIISTVEAVEESVVSIIITKDFISFEQGRARELITQQVWGWIWILVDKEGYILTNKHVLADEDSDFLVVYSDGSTSEVDDIWLDDTLDIALIKVDEKDVWSRSPASIIDFEEPIIVWQFALAIWNALAEFQNSVTFWVISWNNRKLTLANDNLYAGLIQTDTSISEGNSGGPLFNIDGKVIWINTAVSAFGENIWFAIPISSQFVDASIQSVKNYDALVRPFVWVRYVDLKKMSNSGDFLTSSFNSINRWILDIFIQTSTSYKFNRFYLKTSHDLEYYNCICTYIRVSARIIWSCNKKSTWFKKRVWQNNSLSRIRWDYPFDHVIGWFGKYF